MELPLPLPPAVLTPPSLSVALRHIPSLAHKIHTHTHSPPIPGKYKYILCCCSKAITNMAIFLVNKSRTYRSSLDCQQNKSQTWQRHIQAESADKQKPIGVCMCVYGQPPTPSLLLLDVVSLLPKAQDDGEAPSVFLLLVLILFFCTQRRG